MTSCSHVSVFKLSIAAIAAIFLPSCSVAPPQSVCGIVEQRASLEDRTVRLKAEGIFAAHGVSLTDRNCPGERIIWRETPEFAETDQADALSSAALRERFTRFRNLEVDVTGTLQTNSRGDLEIVVAEVHSFRPLEGSSPLE